MLILIGLPGSGKSTFARSLLHQKQRSRVLISTDAIRAHLFGDEAIQGPWMRIWHCIHCQLQQAVQQSLQGMVEETIYDATNAVRRHRRQMIALARQQGFQDIVGIWLDTPLPVCLERNQKRDRQVPDEVIYRMHRCLTGAPPGLEEGLDQVLHYRHFCREEVRQSAAATTLEPVDNDC